jgi:hypothetical protein
MIFSVFEKFGSNFCICQRRATRPNTGSEHEVGSLVRFPMFRSKRFFQLQLLVAILVL